MIRLKSIDRPVTAQTVSRRRRVDFTLMYLGVLGVGMFVAAFAWTRSWQPYISLATAVLLMTWLAWIVRPRLGLNLTLFLALFGDTTTIASFPFNKNMSSHESIFWIADGIWLSPLEVTLGVALLSVGGRRWLESRRVFAVGDLVKPLALLVVMICFGFANGIGRGAGDLRVAIFEVRPLVYFPIIYLVTISVCDQARHYRHLLYSALAAIGLQSFFSTQHAFTLSEAKRAGLESFTEHGASIGMNLLFVTLIASTAIRGCPWQLRTALWFVMPTTLWIYMLSQRRVAFVAFALALGLFAMVLFWHQRRTFWKVVPIAALIAVASVGIFWNSTGALAFPAQAVKTVIAPDDLSAKDQSSDLYRDVENFNLRATIRSSPVLGVGFGKPFLRPIQLADISSFEFYEYIPHNSLLWLWIKTGIVGFVAFLYILATAIAAGVDRVRRQASGIDLVVSIAGLLFVVMFAVYLFADIAWEPRNSMMFGVCLALCTSGVGLNRAEGGVDAADPDAKSLNSSEDPDGDARIVAPVGI